MGSGYTMTVWAAKNMGELFRGVTDEETLESVIHHTSTGTRSRPTAGGCQCSSSGRRGKAVVLCMACWVGRGKAAVREADSSSREDKKLAKLQKAGPSPKSTPPTPPPDDEIDPCDLMLTMPLPRYSAMLAVLRNTLYMYAPCFSAPCHL